MATTTTNLGLTKPAYTDTADIGVINTNMDLIDAAVGAINQSTLRDVPFAVAVSAWSESSGTFTANFTSAYITTSSKEILTYDSSLASYAKAHINATKKSGGGGITFTTTVKPTGTITGNAYVFDNDDHKLPTLIEATVTPIANGGTGQSSLAGAQQALGITALSNQIANFGEVDLLVDETNASLTQHTITNVNTYKYLRLVLTNAGDLNESQSIMIPVPTFKVYNSSAKLVETFFYTGSELRSATMHYGDDTHIYTKVTSSTTCHAKVYGIK